MIKTKKITCIICPTGCEITVTGDDKEISSIKGFECKRGEVYAGNELTAPSRILTTSVKTSGCTDPLVPVRSSMPLPMEHLMPCMEEIKKKEAMAPIVIGDIIIKNIMNTGVDIVATASCHRP